MNIFKKGLAAVLSVVIASSAFVTTSLAAEGDVWATWTTAGSGATVGAAYTEFATSQGKEASGFDWRGDNGARQALTANDVGTLGNPIWGCEATCLDTSKDFTVKFTVKLEESAESLAIDGEREYLNIDPRLASGDASVAIVPNWITLDDLRLKTAESEAAGNEGVIELYRVITKETMAPLYEAGTLNTTLEIRLQGPSAYPSVVNTIAADFADVDNTLTVQSIELIEGNVAPAGELPGWNPDGKYYENGVAVTDKVVDSKDGSSKTYITADGSILTNAFGTGVAAGYYFDADGKAVRGLQTIAGTTYYFGTNYKLYNKAGIIQIGAKKYALTKEGKITKNAWVSDCYFGADGGMYTNKLVNGFGVGADGKKIKNKVAKVAGKYYLFGATGAIVKTGKLTTVGGKKAIADKSGVVKVNAKVGSYIVGGNGYILTNTTKKIGKKTYAIAKTGKVVTGTKIATVAGKKYAVVKGVVKTGKKNMLVTVAKKKYVVNKKGQVQVNKKKIKVGKKNYKTNKKGIATLIKK